MLSTTTAAAGAATSLPRLPILEAVAAHDPASTAVIHALSGRRFTYGELLGDVARARERLREAVGGKEKSLTGERVAFLIENSYDYVGMSHTSHTSRLRERYTGTTIGRFVQIDR